MMLVTSAAFFTLRGEANSNFKFYPDGDKKMNSDNVNAKKKSLHYIFLKFQVGTAPYTIPLPRFVLIPIHGIKNENQSAKIKSE